MELLTFAGGVLYKLQRRIPSRFPPAQPQVPTSIISSPSPDDASGTEEDGGEETVSSSPSSWAKDGRVPVFLGKNMIFLVADSRAGGGGGGGGGRGGGWGTGAAVAVDATVAAAAAFLA